MEKQITLTSDTFKALAGEKRVQILKELKERRKTQSELAQKLGLSAPTVAEHLALLEKAGLVHAIEDGHKWRYFALTEKGREILTPGETKILVLLGTSLIGFIGAIGLVLYRYGLLGGSGTFGATADSAAKMAVPAVQGASAEAIQQANEQTIQTGIIGAIQNALQQLPGAAKTAAGSAGAPVAGQGAQDANNQLSRAAIQHIASQTSQEIVPSLLNNPPVPAPPVTHLVPLLSVQELTILVFFTLLFGLALGFYLRNRQQS